MDLVYNNYEYDDESEIEYADYYDEETYDPADLLDEAEDNPVNHARLMSLDELYRFCIVPTVLDSYKHLLVLMSFAFIFQVSCRIIRLPHFMIHVASLLSGCALVFQMFQWRCKYMAALFAASLIPLVICDRFIKNYRGPAAFASGVIFLIVCENYLVEPLWWHAIRGVQMVLLMKIISIGYDLDTKRISEMPKLLEIVGYISNPGSILFGPWISFTTYKSVLNPFKWSLRWFSKLLIKTTASIMFLLISTCFVNWFIPNNSSKYLLAFRDALSFRCSHYFVSYLSEISSSLAGIEVGAVSKPWLIELPRSLTEVVIYWNKPMHHWLKTYVFTPSRNRIGIMAAILCTYGTSALFHGLNFQLGAILISLGFYTYTEHGLRKKLAHSLNACVLTRCCKEDCQHKSKGGSLMTIFVNVSFTVVSIFHLAYLGMIFDSSQGMQETGYSMAHTMQKWNNLHYSSHWLTLVMFIIMSIL